MVYPLVFLAGRRCGAEVEIGAAGLGAIDEMQPLTFFAGIWTPWKGAALTGSH
ncbi:hypothetical protein I6F15_31330 [Bradyrhizobium sp. BRP14]|nr:hypothetical protein [Bradyrhizobium sp. BRP14]